MNIKPHFPRIVCKDGSSISVQASEFTYCTPRENKGPYTEVEVGYPQGEVPASWKPYNNEEDSIYAYLPIELVEEFITLHGGIDLSKLL